MRDPKVYQRLSGTYVPEEPDVKSVKFVAPKNTSKDDIVELVRASMKMIGVFEYTIEDIKHVSDGRIESPFGEMNASQYVVKYRTEVLH